MIMFVRATFLSRMVYPYVVALGTGLLAFCLLSPVAFAHGISAADKQAMLDGGYIQYIILGASHMLTGYDHLLFLFGVMFFLVTARDIVKFVTAFTVGHSITLVFATFAGITANYFLVDAVIALSVCYKGFDNNDGFKNYFSRRSPHLLVMVFVFGLIHGFGLSTRLQQLPLGNAGTAMLGRILSFNIGVELGQIMALLVMVAVLTIWRKRPSFKRFSRMANNGLIVAGLMLFCMQMFGYVNSLDALKHEEKTQLSLPVTHSQDVINIVISAHSSKEYKFMMVEGAILKYTWETTGTALFFDFHGEPAGDDTGYFKSFKKDTKSQSSGSLTASFHGTHGWYWKNSSNSDVTVTLTVEGEYLRQY